MSEYIDRNALLKTIHENPAKSHGERCSQLLEAILNAPTVDAVKVVRCKDCIFAEKGFDEGDIYCKLNDVTFGKDSFCSYGKRK